MELEIIKLMHYGLRSAIILLFIYIATIAVLFSIHMKIIEEKKRIFKK